MADECYVCLAAGGVRACRCVSPVHITCLAPLILATGFKCKACGGDFNKAVVVALVRRLVATHGMTPARRYLLVWALVRDGRAEEVLSEVRALTAEATDFPTSRCANISVFRGRALLQLGRAAEAIAAFRSARAMLESRAPPALDDDGLDVYANALLGLGLSYMHRGWYRTRDHMSARRTRARAVTRTLNGSEDNACFCGECQRPGRPRERP